MINGVEYITQEKQAKLQCFISILDSSVLGDIYDHIWSSLPSEEGITCQTYLIFIAAIL